MHHLRPLAYNERFANLCCVYAAASDVAGKVAWWTTAPNRGTAPYKMVVQDNGNVVVSDSLNQVMWATNTARG